MLLRYISLDEYGRVTDDRPASPSLEPCPPSMAHNNTNMMVEETFSDDLLSYTGVHMSHLPLSSTAHCGLSLSLLFETIRYICFSASHALDFHLRIHHLQNDPSVHPPSWLGCIIACLPVFIADAKSLQMLHHFLFPMPVISLFFFFVLLLSAQSGHSLKEACL